MAGTGQSAAGLTANRLKWIAVIAMAAQHSAILFLSHGSALYDLLFAAGKVTAPVMCFFIAEGYCHTRSREKYLGRLLLGALLSHVPHALAFGFSVWEFWRVTSVMWSLFLGLLALMVWERKDWPLPVRTAAVLLCCMLSYPGNWNAAAVLWVLAFGVFRGRGRAVWAAFAAVSCIHFAESFLIPSPTDPLYLRFFVFMAVPLLMQYNGQLGRKCAWIQWGYYLFYPLHFLILYGLARLAR